MTSRDRPDYEWRIKALICVYPEQLLASVIFTDISRDLDLAHARIDELSAEIASLRAALTFTKDERDRLEGNHPCP